MTPFALFPAGRASRRLVALLGVAACALLLVVWSDERTESTSALPSNSKADPRPESDLQWLVPARFARATPREAAVLAAEEPGTAARATRTTTIRCRTDAGVDPEGIRVLSCTGASASWRELGRTDRAGALTADTALLEDAELRASRADLSARPVYAPDPVPETLWIEARSGASIRGRVELPDGSSAGPGVRVLAIPGDHPRGGSAEVRKTIAAGRLGVTDAQGEFVVPRLSPGAPYILCGAGSGLFCSVPSESVTPGPQSVILRAEFVYGMRVTFRTPDGEPAPFPSVKDLPATALGCAWPDGERLRKGSVRRMLLGVEALTARIRNPRLFLFRSTRPPWGDPPAPADLTVGLPAYEPREARLQLEWLGGEFPEFDCTLVPSTAGLGELIVRFDDDIDLSTRAPSTVTGFGTVRLRHVSASERSPGKILVLRDASPEGEFRLEGIPFGRYRARLWAKNGGFAHPPERGEVPVAIGPEPATLRVPASHTSSLRIELVDEDGAPYRGPALFSLGEGAPEPLPDRDGYRVHVGGGFLHFLRAPYVIPLLPEDTYVVDPIEPAQPYEEMREGPIVVEVAGDRTAVCTIRVVVRR